MKTRILTKLNLTTTSSSKSIIVLAITIKDIEDLSLRDLKSEKVLYLVNIKEGKNIEEYDTANVSFVVNNKWAKHACTLCLGKSYFCFDDEKGFCSREKTVLNNKVSG